MTNYNNSEDILFNNESSDYTHYNTGRGNHSDTHPKSSLTVNDKARKGDNGRIWASVGTGVLIGGVSVGLMSMGTNTEDSPEYIDNAKDHLSHPEWVDGDISIAKDINDNMSFNEAFASARSEVGPGGVFEWHGQLYGTYTAAEWAHMNSSEKAAYASHFSWNHIDHSNSIVAHHDIYPHELHVDAQATQSTLSDIELENQLDHQIASNHGGNHDYEGPFIAESLHEDDPNVEILGVIYDDENNTNIGKMTIDGQEVILIDVDHDEQFDYMAVDVNNDGMIDNEELTPMHEENLMVDDLRAFSDDSNYFDDSHDLALDI